MVIRKVGVGSAGKIFGTLYFAIGLIIGAIFALFSLLGAGMGAAFSEGGDAGMLGALFGVGAIIILPICYGVIGFIGGIIMALVYNIVAGMVGGLQIEVDQ